MEKFTDMIVRDESDSPDGGSNKFSLTRSNARWLVIGIGIGLAIAGWAWSRGD